VKTTVFIDGQHGTTGLTIHERLKDRPDIEVVELPADKKKDPAMKAKIINEVDVVFLCLPDDAARESTALIKNDRVKVIDSSCAHRTMDAWVYGFPELDREQRGKIAAARRVTVPGCHATGFVACLHPLRAHGYIPSHWPVSCSSISGYSGGGKRMIGEFEHGLGDPDVASTRPKNLDLAHKHGPEMKKYGLLDAAPLLVPIVGNFYKGMLVMIPLPGLKNPADIRVCLEEYYAGEAFIHVASQQEIEVVGDGFLSPLECHDTNRLDIFVFHRDEDVLLVARLDNLGKGAGGAAVQCLNIMSGAPEGLGLTATNDHIRPFKTAV
jgi:N-acetyl-gamma-glutamyl-phosphate reductase